MATAPPTLASYLAYWLRELVDPNLAPATATNYDMFVRLYIVPELGKKRLDKLSVQGRPGVAQRAPWPLPVLRTRQGRAAMLRRR
ncbi:hypothetical protein GCM10009735_13880 [Actinomadura chokoriensis]